MAVALPGLLDPLVLPLAPERLAAAHSVDQLVEVLVLLVLAPTLALAATLGHAMAAVATLRRTLAAAIATAVTAAVATAVAAALPPSFLPCAACQVTASDPGSSETGAAISAIAVPAARIR